MKTSIKNVLTKDEKFMRSAGWTTNGFWLLKSKYEPKVMQRREVTEKIDPKAIVSVLRRAGAYEPQQLTVCADMGVDKSIDYSLSPVRVLKASKAGMIVRANNHYIEFFKELGATEFCMDNMYKYAPIVAMKDLQVMGLIMPLNIY